MLREVLKRYLSGETDYQRFRDEFVRGEWAWNAFHEHGSVYCEVEGACARYELPPEITGSQFSEQGFRRALLDILDGYWLKPHESGTGQSIVFTAAASRPTPEADT